MNFKASDIQVSIHASVKDATSIVAKFHALLIKVSIHASVKDATGSGSEYKYRNASFNPRICKRCDCKQDGLLYHK